MRILIVGGVSDTSVGQSFQRAALALGHDVRFLDNGAAFRAHPLLRSFHWHVRGHRPARLREFSAKAAAEVRAFRPEVLLTTGIAPLRRAMLEEAGRLGVYRINYSTDDPFGGTHRSGWFLDALPGYDLVCTPRHAAEAEYARLGIGRIEYLPFGYDEDLFFRPPITDGQRSRYASDVVFVGGADAERVPCIDALLQAGLRVGLYGSYWDRFSETRGRGRGQIGIEEIRLATAAASIALCLVRRSNRDGNSMRTFEVPAIGTCMLTEWTEDHEELFGRDGEAVLYFRSIPEMTEKARWLLAHPDERARLAARSHAIVTSGQHTYRDRLHAMLALAAPRGRD